MMFRYLQKLNNYKMSNDAFKQIRQQFNIPVVEVVTWLDQQLEDTEYLVFYGNL